MTTAQIVLLILGIAIVIVSFFVVDRDAERDSDISLYNQPLQEITEDDLRVMKSQIHSISEEEIMKSLEETKDALSKLSNETIMSIHEFSDQVLAKIDHNNEEVVFLYNMLTTKEEEYKILYSKMELARKENKELLDRLTDSRLTKTMNETTITTHKNEKIEKEDDFSDTSLNGLENTLEDHKKSFDTQELWKIFDLDEGIEPEKEIIQNKIKMTQNKNEAILKLYKQKKSVLEISRELGIGQGEVKLVIDLYGKKANV